MKNLLFIALCLSMAACSSVKIGYDYDKSAPFSNYKTYAFTEEALNLPVGDLNRDRVIRATENELSAKGFSKSDSPDVLIDIHIKTEKKTEATATTTGPGAYGYYGRYRYAGGFSTTQVSYNDYVEGTLFINMIDKSTEKIVWQGRGTKTLDQDASAEKREESINYAVKQIFSKYPPVK